MEKNNLENYEYPVSIEENVSPEERNSQDRRNLPMLDELIESV